MKRTVSVVGACLSGQPNVMVERLTLLLLTREVPGSNLGPETSYLDLGFSWFSSVHPDECRDSTLN
jgi:hypothetical protein